MDIDCEAVKRKVLQSKQTDVSDLPPPPPDPPQIARMDFNNSDKSVDQVHTSIFPNAFNNMYATAYSIVMLSTYISTLFFQLTSTFLSPLSSSMSDNDGKNDDSGVHSKIILFFSFIKTLGRKQKLC